MKNLNIKTSTAKAKVDEAPVVDEDALERELQYKTELLWCQDHIRTEMEKPNATDRQKESLIKAYNVLVNEKSSMVHKRQVMNQHCGDYRKKMAQEAAKRNGQPSAAKVLNIARERPSTCQQLKGTFLKARQAKLGDASIDTADFKFDFDKNWKELNEKLLLLNLYLPRLQCTPTFPYCPQFALYHKYIPRVHNKLR